MKNTISIAHVPTEDEKHLVQLLSSGLRALYVAEQLGITENALTTTLSNMRYKYGAKNSIELVAKFIRAGVI